MPCQNLACCSTNFDVQKPPGFVVFKLVHFSAKYVLHPYIWGTTARSTYVMLRFQHQAFFLSLHIFAPKICMFWLKYCTEHHKMTNINPNHIKKNVHHTHYFIITQYQQVIKDTTSIRITFLQCVTTSWNGCGMNRNSDTWVFCVFDPLNFTFKKLTHNY